MWKCWLISSDRHKRNCVFQFFFLSKVVAVSMVFFQPIRDIRISMQVWLEFGRGGTSWNWVKAYTYSEEEKNLIFVLSYFRHVKILNSFIFFRWLDVRYRSHRIGRRCSFSVPSWGLRGYWAHPFKVCHSNRPRTADKAQTYAWRRSLSHCRGSTSGATMRI